MSSNAATGGSVRVTRRRRVAVLAVVGVASAIGVGAAVVPAGAQPSRRSVVVVAATTTTTAGSTSTTTTGPTGTGSTTTTEAGSSTTEPSFGGLDSPPFVDDHATWGDPNGAEGKVWRALAAALGDRFAGTWTDPATRTRIVGVTDVQPGDQAAIRTVLGPVDQELDEVRHPLAELSTVARRIVALIPSGASYTFGVDVPENRIDGIIEPTALAGPALAPLRALMLAQPDLVQIRPGIGSTLPDHVQGPPPTAAPAVPIPGPARFTG